MPERVKIRSSAVRRRREANRRLAFLLGGLLITLGAAAVAPSVSDVGEAAWDGALRLVQFEMPDLAPGEKHTMLRAPLEPTGIRPDATNDQ